MAKVTDIKNTKIRVENEDSQKIVIDAMSKLGAEASVVGGLNGEFLLFVTKNYLIMHCGNNIDFFERDKNKEIWFYNGEFHDKPQDDQCDEIEWKNGDECAYKHIKGVVYTYIGAHPSKQGHFVFNEEQGITYIHNDYLEKPLSKEEIEKHERLEAAYDLYCDLNINKESRFCFNIWKEEAEFTGRWLRVVDKTGYRKGEL